MDKRAEKLIESYESEKRDKLLKEFKSLSPKPFYGAISFLLMLVAVAAFDYFYSVEIFQKNASLLFPMIIVAFLAIDIESKKINKRIDLLARLMEVDSENSKDSMSEH